MKLPFQPPAPIRLRGKLLSGLVALLVGTLAWGCAKNQTSTTKDKRPLVVFVTGDHEYSGESTLPILAAELEKNYGMRTKVLKAF